MRAYLKDAEAASAALGLGDLARGAGRVAQSHDAGSPLTAWLALLTEWNKKLDLTAARSEEELLDLMLADALVLAQVIGEKKKVVDVGSGAGGPALALALMRPDLEVTLVEPLVKRTSFLRTVLARVSRLDVNVDRARVEDLASRAQGMWDLATSRATLPPQEWLTRGSTLADATCVLLAKEEAPAPLANQVIAKDVQYTWLRTQAARRLVVYERT